MDGNENAHTPTLTVFTPTYNRAHLLHRCYESLCRQTCRDFLWLIIDDGSSDGTSELVSKWQTEDIGFSIRYKYQENKGIPGAHNTAYELIDTELNVCIDSDDYMPDNAVESIINFWNGCQRDDKVAGFAGLDAYEDGTIVGTRFPENVKRAKLFDFYNRYGVRGDKKLVYRSDVSKLNPYILFEGEKYIDHSTKYYRIDADYDLLALNTVICIVEYLSDGFSRNIFNQYVNNPRGYACSRRLLMQLPYAPLRYKFRQAVHYVSSSIMSKDRDFFKKSPCKGITLLALPFGAILCLYITSKAGRKLPAL